MRTRILAAICGTVALSLLLAGVGTYLLLGRQAEQTTEANLRDEAAGLADLVSLSPRSSAGRLGTTRLVRGLRLEGVSVVVVDATGTRRGELPDGVDPSDLDTTALAQGQVISGRRAGITWAAAGTTRGRVTIAIVLTRRAERPEAPIGWFVLAGAIALAVGAGIAVALSAGLTRPLRAARAATVQIASGDLTTRLPEPEPGDHDELADLARAINSMATSLEASRGRERQFLLSVSHDLRTPLTSIQGYAEAIVDGTAPDPTAAAQVIGAESTRLRRLVQDLLDLARLDAHAFSVHLADLPVDEVVVDAAEAQRPAAEAAGVALHVQAEGGPLSGRIDPDRLGQVVANLVENALRYASTQVWVVAQADPAGGTLVDVVDDGPGIAADEVPLIFERLYTSGRQARRGGDGGTGLGLALAREFIAAMGGTIEVHSPALAAGGGARFAIRLPAVAPEAAPG